MKQDKGITLITLLIIIIVLTVLTGTSINLLINDNKTIEKSESAKMGALRAEILDKIQNETKTAINEFGDYSQSLAINNLFKNYNENKIVELIVETNGRLGITFQEQGYEFKYFVSNRGEVTAVSEYAFEKENTQYAIKSKIYGEEKNAYELLAPVPLGFVASKIGAEITPEEFTANENDGMVNVTLIDVNGNLVSDKYYFGEDKIEHGLVIYEGEEEVYNLNEEELKKVQEERNQFVWIPVEEEDLNNMLVADESGDLYYIQEKELITMVDASGEEREAKLRTVVEPYFDYELVSLEDNKENGEDNKKEIEFLNEILEDELDKEVLIKRFNNILRRDFNNMIVSIKKYGGFFINRDFPKSSVVRINWMNWWKKQNNMNKENIYYNNEYFYTNTIYQTQYELIKKFTDKSVFLRTDNTYRYYYPYYGISNPYSSYIDTAKDATMVKNIKRLNYEYHIITQGMVVDNSKFEGEFELDSENKLTFSATNLNFAKNSAFSKFAIDKEESVIVNEKGDFIIEKIDYNIPYTSTFFATTQGTANNTWIDVDKIEGKINFKNNKITGKIFLKFYNDKRLSGTDELDTSKVLKELTKEFSGTIDFENKKFYGETNYTFVNVVYAGGKKSHKAGMNKIKLRHSWMGFSDASSRMTLYMK